MLKSIQFNNELVRGTIKIYDESPDDSLFINLHRVFAGERCPSSRGVISQRNHRAFSSWLLSFGMSIVSPLSRLRRQLSQRESQASRAMHHIFHFSVPQKFVGPIASILSDNRIRYKSSHSGASGCGCLLSDEHRGPDPGCRVRRGMVRTRRLLPCIRGCS